MVTRAARLMLIDRVSPEEPEPHAYQNRVEKLRTPSKTYVSSESQLVAGGPTAKVAGSSRAGNSELQVIEMSQIKLHHHDQEDHIVYVARGRGILRMGERGQETREVKPGGIVNLPRGGAPRLRDAGR